MEEDKKTTMQDVVEAWIRAFDNIGKASDIINAIPKINPAHFIENTEENKILFAKLADSLDALNNCMSDLPDRVVIVQECIDSILVSIAHDEEIQYVSAEEAAEMNTDDPALEAGEDDGTRPE